MLRNAKIEGFKIIPWDKFANNDERAMTWIWNQLMGETEKGDTLEFVELCRGEEKLCTGILKNSEGKIKALIPARYERYQVGSSTLDTVDYLGITEHDEGERLDAEFEYGNLDVDIDALALKFLSEKEPME